MAPLTVLQADRDAITQSNAQQPRLLLIPAELLRSIYACAFDSAEALLITHRKLLIWPHIIEGGSGLLSTCRQLYYETHPYLNTYFHLVWPAELEYYEIHRHLGSAVTRRLLSVRCADALKLISAGASWIIVNIPVAEQYFDALESTKNMWV